MTHTLHRRGTEQNLSTDFVLLAMAAKEINEEGAADKMREFLRIASRYKAVNMGDMRIGSIYTKAFEDILSNITSTSIVHAVFTDIDTVSEVVKALKVANLGVSIVLSSVHKSATECAKRAGLKVHTREYSMGIWGALDKLPSEETLQITTMCGHGMVASKLVESFVEQIKSGKTDPRKASIELTKQCVCGIFNPVRAETLLRQ